jgi:amidase
LCPASVTGVVGIKPTVGRVSRAGVVPISHTQDTPGPMARTVADAAALLGVLAGPDPRDPATAEAPALGVATAPDGLRGARIGVARNLAGFHDRTDRVLDDALAAMRDAGAEVLDPVEVPHADELEDPELLVLLFEFKADLEAYLAGRGGPLRTLADLIAFDEREAEREMPYFGQELFEQAAEKPGLDDPAYLEALATCRRLSREEGLDAALASSGADALVAPTNGPSWVTDHANGDHYVGGNSTPAAVAGYPVVTVPMGTAFGLPVGISFIGPAWSEPTLVRLASGFERVTAARRPPAFLATLPEA